MTASFVGMLLLLYACCKIFFWSTSRLIRRHYAYEITRVKAGSIPRAKALATSDDKLWVDPIRNADDRCAQEVDKNRLSFFGKRPADCDEEDQTDGN